MKRLLLCVLGCLLLCGGLVFASDHNATSNDLHDIVTGNRALVPLHDNGGGTFSPYVIAKSSAATAVILSTTTSGTGANWVNLADQPCTEVTIYNLTGQTLSFRRNGAGVSIEVPDGVAKRFEAITNANQIGVQRFDQSNSTVSFKAEAVTR